MPTRCSRGAQCLILFLPVALVACSPVERVDAGPGDAGEGADAGARDAAPLDAGPISEDSGPLDSGPGDAGSDGGVDGGPDAGPAPDAPLIEGEASAGHDSPSWLWNTPAGATEFRYRIDSGAYTTTAETSHQATGLAPGSYTIEVLACTAAGACSAPGTFTTVVESLGPGYPDTIWDGVARPNLATSPLGNVAPVACHNCYNGPSNEVFDTAAALDKIQRALGNDADLIELDVGDSGGAVCVHHDDPVDCTGAPTLGDILADATLAGSDAMLFVEIKETTADPAAFATQLLDVLDANRSYVRNGRPLFVRAFRDEVAYLEAIRTAAASYPLIEAYLRYSVRYEEDVFAVGEFQSQVQTNVADAGFDMIELDYQQRDFAAVVDFARSIGLGVAVYTIPTGYGHALISAVREMVDQFTVEFIVDQARIAVQDANLVGYVNTNSCASSADTTTDIFRNFTGTVEMASVLLDQAPVGDALGTPALFLDAGQDWFGCTLDYRAQDGRVINLGDHAADADGGYLVTAYVNFDTLSSGPQQSIIGNTEAGGFGLEIQTSSGITYLQFVVRVGDEYVVKRYDVSATGLESNPSLGLGDGYFLLGLYDGDGQVRLWIDGEAAGEAVTASGGVVASGEPILVGAQPSPTAPLARSPFHGLIQSAAVLRWGDHDFAGPQVN